MKGLKAANSILISTGTFDLDTADDAIHADASITINGGTVRAVGGKDASGIGGGCFAACGAITINGRDIDDYFGLETLKLIVNQPFGVTGTAGKFDIIANVNGGGLSGQAGAIRHGLARALVQADEANKPALKAAGFLTRDPRMKERKKYGLKGARRAPQFSKR